MSSVELGDSNVDLRGATQRELSTVNHSHGSSLLVQKVIICVQMWFQLLIPLLIRLLKCQRIRGQALHH